MNLFAPVLPQERDSHPTRRKIRKGTHSCWECKRRKMRCLPGPPTNGIAKCQGCSRRGSTCLGQEFPATSQSSPLTADTSSALDSHTAITSDSCDAPPTYGLLTPASTAAVHAYDFNRVSESNLWKDDVSRRRSRTQAAHGKNSMLSCRLHETLPSKQDTDWIIEASRDSSILALESLIMPYSAFDVLDSELSTDLRYSPTPDLHPVLIARLMLRLAACLHHFNPNAVPEVTRLAQPPRDMMQRLADTAINLVTTNDELLGSIEGLQCVMIESIYHLNKGDLRQSWVSCRRAMTIAQLFGLHRSNAQAQFKVLDSRTRFDPHHMWFRMVALERHLCLMMGLPQGSLDQSMATDAALADDTPMGRLERLHCVLASRVLDRNDSEPGPNDMTTTQALDMDLQKAARILPSNWWLAPTLKTDPSNSQALFWDARRLFAQVFHYSLLIQLHLPYMLPTAGNPSVCEYSRITCVNASREVISRFVALRSTNKIALDCRTIDFFALMAAMVLLIAHIDGHRVVTGNLLAHQYLGDRAMIEQVQCCMEGLHRLNSDALSAQSATLLDRLLVMEKETAVDDAVRAPRTTRGASTLTDEGDYINVGVRTPYYNIIKIAREGVRKDNLRATNGNAPIHSNTDDILVDDGMSDGPSAMDGSAPLAHDRDSASEFVLDGDRYTGLSTGDEGSVFQGVDMAFFDSLMRTSGGEEGLNWT